MQSKEYTKFSSYSNTLQLFFGNSKYFIQKNLHFYLDFNKNDYYFYTFCCIVIFIGLAYIIIVAFTKITLMKGEISCSGITWGII